MSETLKIVINALSEINDVICEGEGTHKKNEWRTVGITTHIKHIDDHFELFKKFYGAENKLNARSIENLSHATTRCLMSLQLIIEERSEFMEKINGKNTISE